MHVHSAIGCDPGLLSVTELSGLRQPRCAAARLDVRARSSQILSSETPEANSGSRAGDWAASRNLYWGQTLYF